MLPSKFTIRVYGLLMEQGQLLLSLENIRGKLYLKFPGGGLEFGEGTHDCVTREFMEEAGIKVSVKDHFFTTDTYLLSAFDPSYQVISIYYTLSSTESSKLKIGNPKNRDSLRQHNDQILYWQAIETLNPRDFELPIDRLVVEKLLYK